MALVSRPFGTYSRWPLNHGVETPCYCLWSLAGPRLSNDRMELAFIPPDRAATRRASTSGGSVMDGAAMQSSNLFASCD